MAYITTEDHKSAAGSAPASLADTPQTTTAQNIVISPAGMSEIPVPGHGFVTNAVMTQEGNDLILESPDGITLVIEGYFSGETPPDLVSPDGKVLTPALVKSFIQASTDYAEEKTAMNDATPIGQASEVSGHATVTHPNGTTETVVKGTPIFEGDIIETDVKGAVNIKFADESSFAISNNAKLAIDEFVFDSTSGGGENKFAMLRGLFVYTSGMVGREDPDDVKIETPVGTIGIRGTIITGALPAEGEAGTAKISVIEGAIVITPNVGDDIVLSKQFETVEIDTSSNTATNVGVLPQAEMVQTFNVLRTVAPTLFSAMEEAQQEGQGEQKLDAPATPEDAAPQEEAPPTVPEAPTKLNLMPDRIDANPLAQSPLDQTSDEISEVKTLQAAQPIITLADAGGILTAAGVNLDIVRDQRDTLPSTGGGGTDTSGGSANIAPIRTLGTYIADEQSGLRNGTPGGYSFDISRFFRDADGDTLTYSVVGGSIVDPSGANGGVTVVGNRLLFSISTSFSSSTPQDFTVDIVASDGTATSNAVTVTIHAYKDTGTFGSGSFTGTGNVFAYGTGGTDAVSFSVNSRDKVIWAGAGNDTAQFNMGASSTGINKFFGEDGDDTVTILSSTGASTAFASGGAGTDTFNISDNRYRVFGGEGTDTFNLLALDSINALNGGSPTGLIDGGTGRDILNVSGNIDLRNINADTLMDMEVVRTLTGAQTVTLEIADIVQHGNGGTLFLQTDAADTVNFHNSGVGYTPLTATGGTDATGFFNEYSNGNITLYIHQSTGAVNII